jgi:ATPase subunit of ABC transporter with duplicated ATPase domains
MPAIKTVGLCWSTPDGQPVISNLNLTFKVERAGIVGRNGVGKTSLLKLLSGDYEPIAGRIIVQGTTAMLRQIVQVRQGDTIADLFGVSAALDVLRRAERGQASIDEVSSADWSLEAKVAAALASVRLDAAPHTRLGRLSGGQRTRAAMAAVVLRQPDFLLLDEPTNNLDRDGRAALLELLGDWRAGAIVVSHDRELLDNMDAIIDMTTLGAKRYGGNWTQYRERKAIELAAVRHDLDVAERQIAEIEHKNQVAVERKQRRDAAGNRKGARGDLPRILVGARKQRAENSGGDNVRLAERQRAEASAAAIAARAQVEILQTMAVSLAKTALPPAKTVLTVKHVTAGHEQAGPVIRNMSFMVIGPERIAITGPNGSGKTTLLEVISGRRKPWTGRIFRTPDFAMLDQTVDILDPGLSIVHNFQALNEGADEFACRTALARFQFKADAADQIAGTLSGGQLIRAGLACILGGTPPQLLILDEPTNHLDLDSIAAIEAGLSAFDGALLVVSHDEEFLAAIGISRRIALSPI